MKGTAARTAIILGEAASHVLEPALGRNGVTVLERTDDPDRVAALVQDHQPDLLIGPPSANGWGWLRQAKERLPSLRIVVVGGARDAERIDSALRAGATAYVVVGASEDDFAMALRQSFDRSLYLEPTYGALPSAPRTAGVKLTRRETEVLSRVAQGLSNGEIARELWLTEQTIKFHLSNIFKKLGVRNRTSASRWAHQHGLAPAADTRI